MKTKTLKFTCDQCGKKAGANAKCLGYGKTLCSVECFREAGKTYKPNYDPSRGGGVGKESVTI